MRSENSKQRKNILIQILQEHFVHNYSLAPLLIKADTDIQKERRTIMKFVKKEKEETRYFVPEIAQAVGLSEGTIRGYFTNKSSGRPKKSTKDGLTLDEIVEVLERKRTRGDGIDSAAVKDIRHRLIEEKGYVLVDSEEE